ncbi:hypothetical protein K3495_g11230 [Podosphaera aphanis]|nr:hypothetical protein K3495_g11230 [Podosphaera aphanis]
MFTNNFEPQTPLHVSQRKINRTIYVDEKPEVDLITIEDTLIAPEKSHQILPPFKDPCTPPESTISNRSLLHEIQDENFQVGLVQFINAYDRSQVSYNAVAIDIRCENYNDLIRALYEASQPQPGVRWGIARIDVLWELPISMTTAESGNYRETSFRGMQGPALRKILRLMSARGWRDIFVVRYIEG